MRVKKIEVLYEDTHLLLCRKPAGIATQSARTGQQDMVSLVKNERAKKGEEPYVGLIHRLDQPVEGVMVFAKTKDAAAALSKQVAARGMDKYYLAVAKGQFETQAGVLEHYMRKDGKTNLSRVVQETDPEAKLARLFYEVLAYNEELDASLIRVKLDTGRHHQIRVQMASIGHPLLGDQKYNSMELSANADAMNGMSFAGNARGMVALCSFKIGFAHPVTKKTMEYSILPQNPFFEPFGQALGLDN